MREDLSSFELFLQAVLVESLKLLDALIDAVGLRRFWLLGFLNRFLFFLRRSSWIRQVVKVFIKVMTLMSLQLQLSSYNFLEILLVSIFMALLFFFVRTEIHSTLRFFSTSMRFWHCLIFFSISLISWLSSEELIFCLIALLGIFVDWWVYSYTLPESFLSSSWPSLNPPPPILNKGVRYFPLTECRDDSLTISLLCRSCESSLGGLKTFVSAGLKSR